MDCLHCSNEKNGPVNKKRGRKRKSENSTLSKYKSAKELKSSFQDDQDYQNDDELQDVDEDKGIEDEVQVVEPDNQIDEQEQDVEQDNPINEQVSDVERGNLIDVGPDNLIDDQMQVMEQDTSSISEDCFKKVLLQNGLQVTFPQQCQNTVLGGVKGSSACTGIALNTLQAFINNEITLEDHQAITKLFINSMTETVTVWNEKQLSTMDVKSATKDVLKLDVCEMKEIYWNTLLNVGGSNGYIACEKEFVKAIESNCKNGLVFTILPDKSFVVLADEKGNCCLLDSHVHYTKSDNLNFDETVSNKDSRGICVFGKKDSGKTLLKYIFSDLSNEIKFSDTTGCMTVLRLNKKN